MSGNDFFSNAQTNDEPLTESQVIPFNEAADAIRPESGAGRQSVSIIGETLHFNGELAADEDLVIEGKVEGKINQGKCCLTVRPKGQVIANVNATKIFIEGTVVGNLTATVSVTIRDSGNVRGNIVAPRIAINEGATFNGGIEMRDPKERRST
ncbi:MAG: polymer-forming cytoskeletal protein [Pseudomonadota bacterium]